MEENFDVANLDNLIIKDRNYYCQIRKKILLIFLILIIILAIITGLVFLILFLIETFRKKGGKIICTYNILKNNENIHLINIDNDIKFNLIIDDNDYSQSNYHVFETAGIHKVIFHFKNKLDSLKGFFENIENLIEVDFSQFEAENIESMEKLFNGCKQLTKVIFENKTPNLKNINSMFYKCESLLSVNLNFDTSKVTLINNMFVL